LRAEKGSEAEADLRAAVRLLPHDYLAHFYLSQALLLQKKEGEAKKVTARADELKELGERFTALTRKMMERPLDPARHCAMGAVSLRVGNPEVAEGGFLGALKLDQEYKPAHAALAELYQARGETEKAEVARQRAHGAAAPGAKH